MLTSLFIAVAIVGAVGTSVVAILNLTRQVRSRGRIVIVTPPPPPELKFNVFEDENCTVILSEID